MIFGYDNVTSGASSDIEMVTKMAKNYWGFTQKIPHSFWNGTTGIVPIDTTIKKILETGYCHYIRANKLHSVIDCSQCSK